MALRQRQEEGRGGRKVEPSRFTSSTANGVLLLLECFCLALQTGFMI